jgi:hypothetical protein
MRLTVNIEEDLYRVAKSVAVAEECSISAAINKLLRRALAGRPSSRKKGSQGLSDFPVTVGCHPITEKDVASVDLDEDQREWSGS